jgi:hypothetical protein
MSKPLEEKRAWLEDLLCDECIANGVVGCVYPEQQLSAQPVVTDTEKELQWEAENNPDYKPAQPVVTDAMITRFKTAFHGCKIVAYDDAIECGLVAALQTEGETP